MKTKISSPKLYLLAIILSAFFMTSAKLNAQLSCLYPITNNLNCDLYIGYEYLDANNQCLCCGWMTVPPGTSTIPTPACCSIATDMAIFVFSIGSIAAGQSQAVQGVFNGPNLTDGGSCTNGCGQGGSTSWSITWTASGATVN